MSKPLTPRPKAPSVALLRFLRSRIEPLATPIIQPATRRCQRFEQHSRASRRVFSTTQEQHATPLSYFSSKSSKTSHQQSPPIDFSASFYPSRNKPEPWSLLSRLPGFSYRSKSSPPGNAPQEPPIPSFLDDVGSTLSRPKAIKPASDPKLRCTEIDQSGKLKRSNARFSKADFISKFGLLPRDLRKIDSSVFPSILVRPGAILINLLHHRLLIRHDRVILFDADGTSDTHAQTVFLSDLQQKLSFQDPESSSNANSESNTTNSNNNDNHHNNTLPYEFRALEAVLQSVSSGLETEFEIVGDPVIRVVRDLEEDIDRDKLRHLLVYSKRLGTFEQKARLVRDAIDDLLEADDDLVAMYLTERATGNLARAENDHTEVEMLLETYQKLCDEIVEASGNLISSIRNTEEIVKAILDANRNSLMLLDLKFSIGTLGIGSGAFVASLYGMNLKNFIEESDFGFLGVTGSSAVFAVLVCVYGMKKLRRLQRVSMWGEGGSGWGTGGRIRNRERGGWREVAGGGPSGGVGVYGVLAAGEGRHERLRRMKEERKRLC